MTMTRSLGLALSAAGALMLSACTTWSTDVRAPGQARVPSIVGRSLKTTRPATDPAKGELLGGDPKDKPYDAIADISIAVRNTAFHQSPTQEMLAKRLREEAAKIGADAVINV